MIAPERGLRVALAALLLCGTPGCGGVYYLATVTSAANKVESARQQGAESAAPFEYYYAKAHLEQAQVQAAKASYSDAAAFAETADEYAAKAIELTQAAQRRGGP